MEIARVPPHALFRIPAPVSPAMLPPEERPAGLTFVHPGQKLSIEEDEISAAVTPWVRSQTFHNWREGLQ